MVGVVKHNRKVRKHDQDVDVAQTPCFSEQIQPGTNGAEFSEEQVLRPQHLQHLCDGKDHAGQTTVPRVWAEGTTTDCPGLCCTHQGSHALFRSHSRKKSPESFEKGRHVARGRGTVLSSVLRTRTGSVCVRRREGSPVSQHGFCADGRNGV